MIGVLFCSRSFLSKLLNYFSDFTPHKFLNTLLGGIIIETQFI